MQYMTHEAAAQHVRSALKIRVKDMSVNLRSIKKLHINRAWDIIGIFDKVRGALGYGSVTFDIARSWATPNNMAAYVTQLYPPGVEPAEPEEPEDDE